MTYENEYPKEFASKGIAGAGLGLGIAGTALGLMGRNLGLFQNQNDNICCSEDKLINRYEAAQQAKIAELETAVKLRDANTYTDSKILDLYQVFDKRFKDIDDALCSQAVHNQKTESSFVLASQDIKNVKSDLEGKINLEAERRCCGDNSIVTYSNATFYPKQVANVEVGKETTSQILYNPLPDCCGC